MLRLHATSFSDQPVLQPLAADFDELGGSIGRSEGNTLILHDEKRYISRTQALISFRGGVYYLRDHGSASPTFVNGSPVGNGNEVALREGDELRIGEYVLLARVGATALTDPVSGPVSQREPRLTKPPTPDMVVSWDTGASENPTDEIQTIVLPAPKRAAAVAQQPVAPPAAEPRGAADAPMATAAESPPSSEALLRAFLEGAGMPALRIPGGLTPELMNLLGRLMRESLRGTLELLLDRALTKREVRAKSTVIAVRENNPLKFSPTVEAAFNNLLAPHGESFMQPVDAVRDAYNDLRSHQLGFMAGMRAALGGVLARFDPAHLEARLSDKSVLGSLVPSSRRAKLWELYEKLFRDISKEAEDDFQTLVGREFLRAYEAQIDKLEQEDTATKR
jgi:predicted component of type VI protein secretion system